MRSATAKDVAVCGVLQHIEEAGVHSGDSACSIPPYSLPAEIVARDRAADARAGAGAAGQGADERPVRGEGRRGLSDRGQPAREPDGAVRRQGDRAAGGQDRRPGDGRRAAREPRRGRPRARLYRGQGIGVPVRALPRHRSGAGTGNEEHRRSHGNRTRFRRCVRQGAARRRDGPAAGRDRVRVGQGQPTRTISCPRSRS